MEVPRAVRPPEVFRVRRVMQWATAAVVIVIGWRFTLWVSAHLAGRNPSVSRPAGVEGFLPIDAMLALRHWLTSRVIDPVHPAGLAIFMGICIMSLVVARSFCSHMCPVGLLSELAGRLGIRLTGRSLKLPSWLDVPLRSIRFLLLGFFVWAVWFAMTPHQVEAFLNSPYARVVDAKMWLFFAHPSRTTIAVLGVLLVGSVFVRDLWCRYLCPYGALLGLLGRLAPFKVNRDNKFCTDCRACTRACPAQLAVHSLNRVASIECTACQDCVAACPVPGCLAVGPPRGVGRTKWLRPARAMVLAGGLYLAVIGVFWMTGHWQTSVTETEYQRRLREIDEPLYTHVGGMTMQEEDGGATAGAKSSPRVGGRPAELAVSH